MKKFSPSVYLPSILLPATLAFLAMAPEAHCANLAISQSRLSTPDAAKSQSKPAFAHLELSTNMDCNLTINSARYGSLRTNVVRRIAVLAGDLQIECKSVKQESAQAKIALAAGDERSLQLSASRFNRLTDQIVVDTANGLQWTRSDSANFAHWEHTGRKAVGISWHDAVVWCRNKGGGWRLPSRDELGSLVDVRSDFNFSGNWMWSNELDGASKAWFVGLENGTSNTDYLDSYMENKAVCVRNP
ncbi:DUF1566 domain-containing protein [Janthinobacterium sp.]|uniref:Lcl domain-containing protein n=1 Tax=Janthinobacterium sp. TaxID=1871054 RepID=UPI00293D9915|nr:DUF1566 domain-containing protein [Janthinobacterium sp.]